MNDNLSSYFEEPEFKEILAKYEGMVENHTPVYFDAEDLTDISDYYIYRGKDKEADQAMEYSLQLHPDDIDALVYRVRNLYFKGKKEEAYRVMERIEDPTDREVMFLKAELLIEENRFREAEEVYMELAEAEGESAQVMCDIAICYMDINKEEYTRLWMNRIADKGYNVDNSQIYRDLWCDYCMIFGNPEEAEEAFQKSVDEHPYSIKYWNAFTRCYLAQSKSSKAHETVDFSLAIDSNNQEAKELKAYCYMLEDNYEEAINIYKEVLSVMSHSQERIYSLLAQCYVNKGDMQPAIGCYQDWLKSNPKMSDYEKSEIYSYIAMCYCNLFQPYEGMKYIDASLELDPFYYGAIIQKGTLYLQMNMEQEAEHTFTKALDICPNDEREQMIYSISNSYFFLKQYDKVIEWCNMLINEFPESRKKAIVLIAYSYFEMEDYYGGLPFLLEALSIYKKEIEKDPKGMEMLQTLLKNFKEKYKDIDLDNLN
ncbi:MAG: tetratricopeptide repeat protein [Bacteroides sp.]|nr:tetratricopeptide repeat protein [Bacteroides sp.]